MATTTPGVAGEPVEPVAEAMPTDPEQRTYQHMSLRWPAFVVLGLAVLIAVGGAAASALDSSGNPTLTLRSVTIPDGTTIALTPATSALRSVISAGQPPADILASLAVPSGSTVTGSVNSDQGSSQFSRTVRFSSGLSSDQVISFYRTILPRLGWKVAYAGPGSVTGTVGSPVTGATEVLAKRGSRDGYYWEVGAVVLPTSASGSTPYSVALFEVPDSA